MLVTDKVAVVTGAARGIGQEIAMCFAKEGARLVVCDIDCESLQSIQSQLEEIGAEVMSLEVNVAELAEVEGMENKILDKFGRIDILINNAGITRDSLLVRMKEQDWDAVLAVNLKGTFNCTRAVSKLMMKQREGRIINIASIIGLIGNAGQANYAASKAGVIGFTKSIAKELAPRGINVNAIAPGFIQTDMTAKLSGEVKDQMRQQIPLGEFGSPSDVAKVALFLASEDSAYITGQVIRVDGGMTM
jgi:3-oxoacyl-[acyl-carrier protein] reductase